ncbi:MAG: hypothetical protein A6D92_02835 [Symbiobacterium thermophilum]|uniref:Major facilitator superfamily (MFS) profile domain-containing protein n=1 Tax=Symbiobacterium thermophilum TaxID=2734 RepID=A0A1Y2T638_SYMTR|nr:MAG: hypothetical protein A6D92_02835 [Symbiobacterium thermophilum]
MHEERGVLALLRHRNYMLYWFGFLVSNAGAWIQSVAQGWLVYDLSNSAAWLGTVGFVRAFPLIFLSLIGGTVADRLPKRRILYVTQTVQMISAALLGTLTLLGHIQVWHVVLLSAVSACAQAFDQPPATRWSRTWCPATTCTPPSRSTPSPSTAPPCSGRR